MSAMPMPLSIAIVVATSERVSDCFSVPEVSVQAKLAEGEHVLSS